MEIQLKHKIVDFEQYCPLCKYSDRPEKCDPCNECLEVGGNEGTDKPVRFEEGGRVNGIKKRTRKART